MIDLRALSRAGAFDDILCYSRDWFEQVSRLISVRWVAQAD